MSNPEPKIALALAQAQREQLLRVAGVGDEFREATLDETDVVILHALRRAGRFLMGEDLADLAGLSLCTVRRRVRGLRSEGLLRGQKGKRGVTITERGYKALKSIPHTLGQG